MANPSIGAQSFVRLRGQVRIAEWQWQDVGRPGVPGVALWRLHYRGQPYSLTSMRDIDAVTESADWIITYRALVNSTVTVTDEGGETWANQFVRNCQVVSCRAVAAWTGTQLSTSAGARLVVRWDLQDISTS
jgi:hypothetical protein